jgi:predicted GNAT family acetyltransferase
MVDNLEIKFELNKQGRGRFYIERNDEILADMSIAIKDNKLIVYHTEVKSQLRGLNIGKQMIDRMADYARKNKLKVKPLCPFVNAQFVRFKNIYGDIWQK